MTSKERMLIAMTGGKPDRVPVAPDISNMVPMRLGGKPFWDYIYYEDPPLWKAYADAIRHYDFDGWAIYADARTNVPNVNVRREILSKTDKKMKVRATYSTPAGDLVEETEYYHDTPPWHTKHIVTNIKEDLAKWKYIYAAPETFDQTSIQAQKKYVGDDGVVGMCIVLPGFQTWTDKVEGGLEALTYSYYDNPELLDELTDVMVASAKRELEFVLQAKPDFLLLGASGAITMQSPVLFRHFCMPVVKELCSICKAEGMPTMIHSCGKEKSLVEMMANETELDCVNPLEEPPQGDCYLGEIKREYGDKVAMMGNLHTSAIMLAKDPKVVEEAAKKAIDDAAAGGGFILSTGDQCGGNTPDENIFRMIEVAKTYGKY